MKKIVLLALMATLSGCFGHRKAQPTEPTAQTVTAVVQESAPVAENTESSEVAPAPAPKITQPTPETNPATPVQPAPQAYQLPTGAPVPDTAIFKDEPLIPLAGRTLNPLAALAPKADKQISVPWQGEQLKYGLYYSFVKVGTAYIKNRGLVDVNGRQAYVIQTSAFSASVIDSVFKVRDINLSWLDAKNFYSLGYSQSLREGRYQRDEWVLFDYDANTYRGEVVKKSGKRSFSGALTTRVLDMLTSLYFVRGQNLENGKDVVFDILNREEQYPLVVKVIGRETVKTPAGKFKCVIVEPQFRGEGIFVSKGKSLKVWLTDDERKLPVKMETEVFIGSVSAELLEYQYN